jgi:hypothetical protein
MKIVATLLFIALTHALSTPALARATTFSKKSANHPDRHLMSAEGYGTGYLAQESILVTGPDCENMIANFGAIFEIPLEDQEYVDFVSATNCEQYDELSERIFTYSFEVTSTSEDAGIALEQHLAKVRDADFYGHKVVFNKIQGVFYRLGVGLGENGPPLLFVMNKTFRSYAEYRSFSNEAYDALVTKPI